MVAQRLIFVLCVTPALAGCGVVLPGTDFESQGVGWGVSAILIFAVGFVAFSVWKDRGTDKDWTPKRRDRRPLASYPPDRGPICETEPRSPAA